MATESANTTPPARPSLGELWQVPIFLAGVIALAGALIARGLQPTPGSATFVEDLAQVREALGRPTIPASALEHALRLVERTDAFPLEAGTAHFLLGSLHLRRNPQDLAAARRYLEAAEMLGVAPEDRDRLVYRLGQVYALVKEDPQRVLDYLGRSVPDGADDAVEGYGLLLETYLRLPQPDRQAALEITRKQLALPLDESRASAIRLLQGELLVQVEQLEEARKVLERVTRAASPQVYARARALRVETSQKEGLWSDAARLWEELLQDKEYPPPEPDRVRFFLGTCHARLGKPEEAIRVWGQAAGKPTEAGRACALRLAEIQLDRNPAAALAAFEDSVRGVADASVYRSVLVSLDEARQVFEDGCKKLKEKADFERAEKVAQRYASLAPPARSHELLGEIADAWAGQLNGESAKAKLGLAGAAYEAAAEVTRGQVVHAEFLWRSADRFIRGEEYTRALKALDAFLLEKVPNERLGEGWFAMAGIYEKLGQDDKAREALRTCIAASNSGPFAMRALVRLAVANVRDEQWAAAEAVLGQNLRMLHKDSDKEALENTLYTLAHVHYRQEQFLAATQRYAHALRDFPTSPFAAKARLELADSFRRLAGNEREKLDKLTSARRLPPEAQKLHADAHRQRLEESATQYQKLFDDLSAKATTGPLSAAEQVLLREAALGLAGVQFEQGRFEVAQRTYQNLVEELKAVAAKAPLAAAEQNQLREASFGLAGTHFAQGRTGEAERIYDDLARKYEGQVASLNALDGILRCHLQEKRLDRARGLLDRIDATLKNLNDEAFGPSPSGAALRARWDKWLTDSKKRFAVPSSASP